MIKVVGIGFKEAGKIYWFNPSPFNLSKKDKVVVETSRGLEIGEVIEEVREVSENEIEHELKSVIRVANKYDLKNFEENKEKAQKALSVCKSIVKEHNLDMKCLDCEYTLDKQKIIIYYNADGRVDFRELLKDLASEFKVRIELKQIGPREGAKMLGGLGICGREICCKSSLREFDLVTMKMAKDQGMALNASKVAGLCGKLMCCIAYENSIYEEIRSRIPLVGDLVKTPNCECCKVIDVDYMREIIKVANGDKNEVYEAKDVVKIERDKQTKESNNGSDE